LPQKVELDEIQGWADRKISQLPSNGAGDRKAKFPEGIASAAVEKIAHFVLALWLKIDGSPRYLRS
jgi:hypothetical protein